MSLLPIVRWPDPRLAALCAPVGSPVGAPDAAGRDIPALVADMLETMYAAPGRGLAAPQVGVLLRLFVMDVTWRQGRPDPVVCIDPEILWRSDGAVTGPEGCLSIPGPLVEVTRAASVRLAWTDLSGARRAAVLDGFAAVCAQHEIDHLDGIVTLDRIGPEARAKVLAEIAA